MRALTICISIALVGLAATACGPSSRAADACVGSGCSGSDAAESCDPGESEPCYTGAPGTEGVGPCHGGTRTCEGGVWGACNGQVTPTGEVCANGDDENCNGMVDEEVDLDGDGFTTCEGDCCDSVDDGCLSPELVNPGAFEADGNTLDDDCDGMIDNVSTATCDNGLATNSAQPRDYARAMDICQNATAMNDQWGLISAQLVLASGSGTPNAQQRSIRPSFGGTMVQQGDAFAVLSTGNAAATGQTNPGYRNFQTGAPIGTMSAFPADYLAAHGGTLPNAPGCPPPDPLGGAANDPIMLELRIRTPTNARSFSFSVNFLSAEYPEWTCSPFNDFFVALLDSSWSGNPQNPSDKNLAVYTSPSMQQYPVGVNLAFGNTGLFQECVNGATGCASESVPGNINTCTGITGLTGTGMDQLNPPAHVDAMGQPGYCGSNNRLGGGTGWLATSGNVNGGEVITLRIAIWDTSDGIYDSVAIVDNFRWSVEASEPGTVIE